MKRMFSVSFLLILLVGLISASGVYYNTYPDDDYYYKEKISTTKHYPRQDRAITVTRYRNYDNQDRYSTYDYRHGYTYRETKDYWMNYDSRGRLKNNKNWGESYKKYDNKKYYYKYVPYLQEYKKIECYDSPPTEKWFYIKCP